MSQLFDNYTYENTTVIPDNQNEFLPIKPDFPEVLVIGANNTHCFTIPHPLDELEKIQVIYKQGIEEKIRYLWQVDPILGNPHEIHFDSELDNPEINTHISVEITATDTNNFNSYNKDLKCQVQVKLKDQLSDISEIYRIKLVPAFKEFQEDNTDGRQI